MVQEEIQNIFWNRAFMLMPQTVQRNCVISQAITQEYKSERLLFEELDENKKYDGIWACSSILHLPRNELKAVFMKMFKALKEDGIIYTSFKYGDFEGERNGRISQISRKRHLKSLLVK